MEKEKIVQGSLGKSKYSESKAIVDSFRFYIMLGILTAEYAPERANDNVNWYTEELLKSGITKRSIQYYIHQASVSLPSEFSKSVDLDVVYFKEKQTFIGQ